MHSKSLKKHIPVYILKYTYIIFYASLPPPFFFSFFLSFLILKTMLILLIVSLLVAVVSAQVQSPTHQYNVTSPSVNAPYVASQILPCIYDVSALTTPSSKAIIHFKSLPY